MSVYAQYHQSSYSPKRLTIHELIHLNKASIITKAKLLPCANVANAIASLPPHKTNLAFSIQAQAQPGTTLQYDILGGSIHCHSLPCLIPPLLTLHYIAL